MGQCGAHRVSGRGITPALLSASPTSRRLLREARRYAAVDATVLITGETGVGKDSLARYIHTSGPRRHEPFITVDCPALPPTLVGAELFGHERGAFTDATAARAGRFEQAGRGTVYLNAVTGLSTCGQGALLRVLEERRVTRLGAVAATEIHARFIASGDAEIEELVATDMLRADLYHRLRVLPVRIPPLRERRDEIVPLARHFLTAISAHHRRSVPSLAAGAADALVRYHWPGNIRQLRHVIERVLLISPGDRIEAHDLPQDVLDGCELDVPSLDRPRPTLEEIEHRYIVLTLRLTKGNQTRAAAILGISRKALWEKRKRFGLA